jgi:deaminated glutathione amidase
MRIAVVQMTSQLDYTVNLAKIKNFLVKVREQGAQLVFLPEMFYSLPAHGKKTPYLVEKDNEHYRAIQSLAKEFSVYLVGGSASTRANGKIVNRAYNFDPAGRDLGHYDKIHLFSCDLPDKKINEGDVYTAGEKLAMIKVGEIPVGLSICFDLRFADLYLGYRKSGAQLITVASAFTVPTGKAHWETLLRARAIETQCFIIASAQWGRHHENQETWGHSLVVDPWGEILADAREGEKIIFADLDLGVTAMVRKKIKMN